jgi:hypothetical protein
VNQTRAFIGLAGPFGYDYVNEAPRVNELDNSSPNAVLENVLGLLLCYDELIFLSPQFCPADMRNLPYVRFLTDDAKLLDKATTALSEYDASDKQPWSAYPSHDLYGQIVDEMMGARADQFAIDNHTHGIHLGEVIVKGNGMALDNAMRDLWVVAELGLERVDVIFNSPAQNALNLELERELGSGGYFNSTKRTAATKLATLQVPNFLGPSGSYHESLEAIRGRNDVAEFRQFLSTVGAPTDDGISLASEISRVAFKTVDDLSHRYLTNKHWFRSIGIPAVRGVLNSAVPLVGSVAAVGLDAPFQLGERRFKAASQWAPFVVALHRPTL